MRKVYLWTTLWSLDTCVRRSTTKKNAFGDSKSSIQRLQLLEQMVAKAWTYFEENVSTRLTSLEEDRPIWAFLFVAPEYYFARSSNAHAIEESDKRDIVGRLAEISRRYPRLILVPGTIAWKKPVIRPMSEIRKRDRDTKERTGPLKLQTRYERFTARVSWSMNKGITMIPQIIDREDYRRGPNDPFDRFELESREQEIVDRHKKMLERMAPHGRSPGCYLARNTAYAFYGGAEVARYQKRSNHDEVFEGESEDFVIFEPGGAPDGRGDRFEVEGLKFGIEICLDHDYGYLRHSSQKRPDVHIVVSAEVDIVCNHVHVPEGCFLVHASSNKEITGVYDHKGNRGDMNSEDETPGTLFYRVLRFDVDRPESDVTPDYLSEIERY
jgi:predicted amidohydrolase